MARPPFPRPLRLQQRPIAGKVELYPHHLVYNTRFDAVGQLFLLNTSLNCVTILTLLIDRAGGNTTLPQYMAELHPFVSGALANKRQRSR